MRIFTTPAQCDLALYAYESARITATITGSVGARHIESRIIDGKRIEAGATWHRRAEFADHKHVAVVAR